MDREEILGKFHWHRWGASNMGAITISKEDLEEYYTLIKNLIAENKKLLNELKSAPIMPSEYEVLYKRKCEECEALKIANEELGKHCTELVKENKHLINELTIAEVRLEGVNNGG